MCYVLQKVTKEKTTLAERLKNAEASRKRLDDELKRYAAETQTREEIRKSLENEVRRLTQTVGQTEGEKKEKEEQISRCEAYIDGMQSKLQVCQVFHLAIFIVCTVVCPIFVSKLTSLSEIAISNSFLSQMPC
jgi:predicted nuclease with TOPRIM domain